jgi:4-hydroxy-tetrahydrodipicolinate reductase
MMVRVAIAGVLGRMGTIARTAIEAADDCTFAGGFARAGNASDATFDDLDALFATAKPDVLLDVTTHPASVDVSMRALAAGIPVVVGATGWTDAERAALGAEAEKRGLGALIVPNFALGAVLMMRFAEMAARYFPTVEIVELHHDAKKDAPSGTARSTAERIVAAGGPAHVPIHSVRLRGLVAHQEVLFGGDGELLTLRHDALSREAFAAGILAAVRAVRGLRGLTVGLDGILG